MYLSHSEVLFNLGMRLGVCLIVLSSCLVEVLIKGKHLPRTLNGNLFPQYGKRPLQRVENYTAWLDYSRDWTVSTQN